MASDDKVVDIWYKCLAAVLAASSKADGAGGGPAPALTESKGSEGIEMLSQVDTLTTPRVHVPTPLQHLGLSRDRSRLESTNYEWTYCCYLRSSSGARSAWVRPTLPPASRATSSGYSTSTLARCGGK